jgi:DNA-binding response OmpR family regulator
VPVIILTGSDEEADEVTAMEVGADDYLHKPVTDTRLVARCRAALRRVALTAP